MPSAYLQAQQLVRVINWAVGVCGRAGRRRVVPVAGAAASQDGGRGGRPQAVLGAELAEDGEVLLHVGRHDEPDHNEPQLLLVGGRQPADEVALLGGCEGGCGGV